LNFLFWKLINHQRNAFPLAFKMLLEKKHVSKRKHAFFTRKCCGIASENQPLRAAGRGLEVLQASAHQDGIVVSTASLT
jgi:hypothetical protein